MITYRKKSLRVKNIFASYTSMGHTYTEYVAENLKDFIEKGEYNRIVDVFIYGIKSATLVCSIIYEQTKNQNPKT